MVQHVVKNGEMIAIIVRNSYKAEGVDFFSPDDFSQQLALMSHPAGREMVVEEGAEHFLELCPHSEYVNVTGAGHMVAGDRNDIFADAVVEFLTRTVPIDADPLQKPQRLHPHHEGPLGDVNDVP